MKNLQQAINNMIQQLIKSQVRDYKSTLGASKNMESEKGDKDRELN